MKECDGNIYSRNHIYDNPHEKLKSKEKLTSSKKNDSSTCKDPSSFEYVRATWYEEAIIDTTSSKQKRRLKDVIK